jgi:hypothetical protein
MSRGLDLTGCEGAFGFSVNEEGIIGDIGKVHGRHTDFFTVEVVLKLSCFCGTSKGLGVPFFDGVLFGATHEGSHDFLGICVGPI